MKQEYETATATPAPAANRQNGAGSIADLVRNLATDLSMLLSKEMELAKSEVRESVSEVKTAVGAIATGAVLAMAGLVVLLMSAVYGLSNVVEPWLAALIVGAAALLIGYLMVHSAKEKMGANAVVPERTLESVKKDTAPMKRSIQ
ncbi:MAG: phage holin family protein [Xanthomonadaceae bacterium]|nr:phage holin family protein [Xanthomonadaceae bacterium]